MNLLDFADVFALSNLPSLNGTPDNGRLLVLSQESGKIVNTDRLGNISSSLTIVSDPGNPLTVAAQQHEGLTMDRNGILYVVSENGGGDFDHPQLWVYAPSTAANQPPTAVTLNNAVTSILENTSTASPVKVADISITDDGVGTNKLTLSGTDASFFEITGNALFIKAGTVIDYETKTSYSLTVNVDDTTVGTTPDATTTYLLNVIDVVVETPIVSAITVSEVAPWSSGNSPVGADWFELTNNTTSAVNISGWKMDDNSNSFASSVALNGITTIAPGESVIFLETSTPLTTVPLFLSTWFGPNPPAALQVGSYTGTGVGLSTGGDAVNIYNASGALQANVVFGTSPSGPFPTFNNALGLNNTTITQLSMKGVNGAFAAVNDTLETGSPGSIGKLFISEVAPWSSGNSPVGADWFEITNTRATPVDISGWKMDDNSGSPAAAVALNGITAVPAGKSVIFIETATPTTTIPLFINTWFGANPPADLQIGSYTGTGVGLGNGGDAVNLYNSAGLLQASVIFGASPAGPSFPTFDNAAGLNNVTISQLSVAGVNGAFVAVNDANEIGSPGTISAPFAPLAVRITSLKAAQRTNGVQLEWSALNELNIEKYEAEKSANGLIFSSIGSIASKGNGSAVTVYSYIDASPLPGLNYYRIKVWDKNGRITFSNLIRIQLNTITATVRVYPNPTKGHALSIELNNVEKGAYTLALFNSAGQQLLSEQLNHQGGSFTQSFQLAQALLPGVYQLKIAGGRQVYVQTIMAH